MMDINALAKKNKFRFLDYAVFGVIMLIVFVLCVAIGSVRVSFFDTVKVIWSAIWNIPLPEELVNTSSIIVSVRLPRVICVALVGASLSICGGSMQGLLRNPLADGSTLGVSTGASLGAVISIAFGITLPNFPLSGTMVMAMLFAFLSILFIISLANKIDGSLSTNTIILIGVIYSMFATSIISLITVMASDKVKQITFWTMGSLQGSTYTNVVILSVVLLICGAVLLSLSEELNAFAIGEENARHIGVDVKKVRLIVLILVSVLIGVCVSIGGSIAFVGLVTPHIVRMIVGPNYKKLLPASIICGATFLMLADLIARIILNPAELPIGVVTSFVGAIVFVIIFYRTRKGK
jgi:iron complex transport system permease protein